MSLRYIDRYEQDKEYYITNNFDMDNLMSISEDLKKGYAALKELDQLIYTQVQKVQQAVQYKEIIARRRTAYKGHIELLIHVNTYKLIDNVRIGRDQLIYGTGKEFRGNQKKAAKEYAAELSKQHNCPIVWDNWK